MVQTIYPGTTKAVKVTVEALTTSGSAAHNLYTKPDCGFPNPDREDGANATARASADDTDVTVTLAVPVSAQTVYTVICQI